MQNKMHCVTKPALDYLFYPRSVAIVGVSNDMSRPSGGRVFTETTVKGGFKGPIYPIGQGGGEIYGLKIYPRLTDVTGDIDYVISAIPAQHVPRLLRDCAAKGVTAVHLFTAGFSELGDNEGRRLETEVASIARELGIRLIGPNCMGLYCPRSGLSFCTDFSTRSGSVGFMAQSGGHSLYGVMEANARGIYFSKVISFGNAADLNESDFLEYLTEDAETEVIAIYIEGVRDGNRFRQTLEHAARRKSVIVYKGGMTPSGARTVSSHTGAIAGSATTWSSLIKQAGAVEVHSVAELVDMLVLFQFMAPPAGNNAAIIGLGGGANVQATDDCLNAGLRIPLLSGEVSRKLKGDDFTEAGKIFKNPIDIFAHGSRRFIEDIIRTLGSSDQIDILLPHIPFDLYPIPEAIEVGLYVPALINLAPEIRGRTAVVLHAITLARSQQMATAAQATLAEAGFPVFPSFTRAATAIARFISYYQRHNNAE